MFIFKLLLHKKRSIISLSTFALNLLIFLFFSFCFCVQSHAMQLDRSEFVHRKLIKEEREIIKGRHFTVAYNADHKPFQYTDEDGKADGTIISMINKLATEYSFTVKYEEYNDEKAVQAGYDIIITTIADVYKISRNYQPTIAFHEESLMMIFPKTLTLKDLREKKNIIGILNYPLDFEDLKQGFPEAYFKRFDKTSDLLISYDSGTVDSAMFSRTLLDASMLGEMSFVREYYNKQNTMITSEVDVLQRFYVSNSIAEHLLPIINIMLSQVDYSSTLLHDAMPHMAAMDFSAPTNIRFDLIIIAIIVILLLIIALYQFKIYKKNKKRNYSLINNKTLLLPFSEFSNEVEKRLKHAEKGKYKLIGIDIDLFRLIVAYYGNETAESLIEKMSEMLLIALDGEEALVTRYGKDYFLIYKRIYDDGKTFRDFVENTLTPTFKETTGDHYSLSFSVGMYVINDTSVSLSDMITFAELARRQGKNIHTSTFYTFDEVMNKQYHDKLNITYRMSPALENKEFIIEYQPKVDIKSRKIIGAEALVRWHPPKEDKIYPNDFIPIFEKNGFISKLDIYVFEEVCIFIKENYEYCSNIKIAVNFSPVTLANPEIVQEVMVLIDKYALSPAKFELEIVESVIDDMPLTELINRINEFKKLGFSIALDDFGAGASSLNRFGLLPIDVIKFDKKFIDNIDNERIASTVKNFIHNSKELKLNTVAEGVETKDQLHLMEDACCDIVQGYLFSKPLARDVFLDKLKSDLLFLM